MDEFKRAARDNVDRHIGDVCEPDDDPEIIAEEVFTLAFDGAADAGADHATARAIAHDIAGEYHRA